MKFRIFLIISLVLIVSFTIGVSANDANYQDLWYPSPDADWVKSTDEINVWNLGAISGDPAIREMGLAFEALTGIHVNFYESSGSLEDMQRTLATQSTEFDVYDASWNWAIPDFINAGFAVSLNDVISERQLNQWPESLQDSFMVEGEIYLAPHQAETFALYYRKDLIEKAIQDKNINWPPKNWDELVEAAKILTVDEDADGNIDRYGLVYPAGGRGFNFEIYSTLVYAAGGSMFNKEGMPSFDTPEGHAALQFMVDLVKKYNVAPTSVVNIDKGDIHDLMAAGSAAMCIIENSMIASLQGIETYGQNIEIMKMVPRTEDVDVHYYLKGLGFMVSKYSKHKQAAKYFAAFGSSYIGTWMEGVVELNGPTNTYALTNPYYIERSSGAEVVAESFVKGITENIPERAMVEDIIRVGTQEAIRGTKSIDEAIQWMMSKLQE